MAVQIPLALIATCVVLLLTAVLVYRMRRSPADTQHSNPPQGIVVHGLGRIKEFGVPDISPFTTKLETFLRLARIEYTVVSRHQHGPKGKFPWIEYNGEVIGDSFFIMRRLTKDFNIQVDDHLTPEQKGMCVALQRLIEDSLFWILAYHSFLLHGETLFSIVFADVPLLLRMFLKSRVKGYIVNCLHKQGYGRHTKEELDIIALEDLRALSAALGTKPFLMGGEMCSIDCSCYGILSRICGHGFLCEGLKHLVDSEPGLDNLNQYVQRITAKIWPDLDQLQA